MTILSAFEDRYDLTIPMKALLAVSASLLLTLSAKVSIPFYPVPLTMQTFVVIGLGLALGPRMAAAAVGLYLLQGAAGLPVFAGTPAKGIGLAYMTGPTGGYLVGFLLAAIAAGRLAERGWDRTPLTAFAAAFVGAVVIYIPGLLWLAVLFGFDKPILAWGLTPFLPGDLVKTALAALVFPTAWAALKRRGGL